MSRVQRDKKARQQQGGWFIGLVLPLALAVVYHAGLLYALRLEEPPARLETVTQDTLSVALLPSGSPRLRRWERNLYHWAALADPTLSILPDEQLGFSRALRTKLSLPVSPVPAYDVLSPPVLEGTMPALALTAELPALSMELQRFWPGLEIPAPPPSPITPLPRGVFWRYADGGLLADYPEITERDIVSALVQGEVPSASTRVEIDRQTLGSMARIVILRSCGNTYLDQLVVSALRRALTAVVLVSEVYGQDRRPAYMPASGARSILEVDWTLLPATIATQG